MKKSPPSQWLWPWGLWSLGGAGLLALVAARYRVDVTRCELWPTLLPSLKWALVYTLALALVGAGWLGIARRAAEPDGPTTTRVLLLGLVVHAVAMVGPPFLSDDVLFYAALGRGLAKTGSLTAATQSLCSLLPAGDRFVQILDAHWRCSTSSYHQLFHLLCWGVGTLAKDDLALHLRLYQGIALLAILGTGALTAFALRGSGQRPAAGAALVVLSPCALVEGTQNAHNDALLALGCSLFVLGLVQRRTGLWVSAVVLGALTKLSALLLGGTYVARLFFAWVRRRSEAALPLVLLLAIGGLGLLLVGLALRPSYFPGLSGLIGTPHAPWEYCTRSLECLPRAVLRWQLHRPTAAFAVGLLFRFLGGAWLLYVGFADKKQPLSWLARGILVYYLYLHSWSQSWYFLLLLPLLPHTEGRTRSAILCVLLSAPLYYAIYLVGNCFRDDLAIALTDLAEGLVVVVPPTVALFFLPRSDSKILKPGT